MWAAYLFTLLALISAPSAFKTGNSIIIVAWIAQTFLQLVLLPIIIVGQNIMGKAADARADATYKDAEAILAECLELQIHMAEQDKVLTSLSKAPPPRTCMSYFGLWSRRVSSDYRWLLEAHGSLSRWQESLRERLDTLKRRA
jgi:hypothetical protein